MKEKLENEKFLMEMRKIDFSAEAAEKEKILRKLLNQLENKETPEAVNRSKKTRNPAFTLVAALLIIAAFSMIVYGQEAIRIIKQAYMGNTNYSSEVHPPETDTSLPEEFFGLLYDEDGNPLEEFPNDFDDYFPVYNESGAQVFAFQDGDKIIFLTEDEYVQRSQDRMHNMFTVFNTLEEANFYFCYDYVLPAYLPEGFRFERAEIYNNNGLPEQNTKYMNVYYSNGVQDIGIFLKFMDEDTASEFSSNSEIRELDINGNSVLLIGNGMMTVAIDNIQYTFFYTDDALDLDEIILMVKSMY